MKKESEKGKGGAHTSCVNCRLGEGGGGFEPMKEFYTANKVGPPPILHFLYNYE